MRGKRFFTRNTVIIIVNILAASLLLFCCCFFFVQNMQMFGKDIKSYMVFSPILFLIGILFVLFYIFMLVLSIENRTVQHADRYDLIYKIVFSLTLILLIVRSFLGDFMCTDPLCGTEIPEGSGEIFLCHSTTLNVPMPIIILAIISGIITWAVPKIKDNNNKEF